LQHFEGLYSNKSDLISGDRSKAWTHFACLLFREYNELPDIFSSRIDSPAAHSLAQKFNRLLPNFLLSIIAKLFSFISGSVVGVLLAVTLLGKASILTNLTVFGNSLLWYMIIFSSILAISRSLADAEIPSENPENVMADLACHTHYFPKRWRNKCHEDFVSKEFSDLYQSRLKILIHDILSVVVTPIVFIALLPDKIDDILDFIETHKTTVDGIGEVCDFSTFKPNYSMLFANENHESQRDDKLHYSTVNFIFENDLNPQDFIPNYSMNSPVENSPSPAAHFDRNGLQDSGEALNQNYSQLFRHHENRSERNSRKVALFASVMNP
jgi:hypothetical protein